MKIPSGGGISFEVPSDTNETDSVKEIRAITGLGLKDAKDMVDGAPKKVKEAIAKDEAEKIAEQFKAVGATVEIK